LGSPRPNPSRCVAATAGSLVFVSLGQQLVVGIIQGAVKG
jgi:hypothetical protein